MIAYGKNLARRHLRGATCHPYKETYNGENGAETNLFLGSDTTPESHKEAGDASERAQEANKSEYDTTRRISPSLEAITRHTRTHTNKQAHETVACTLFRTYFFFTLLNY